MSTTAAPAHINGNGVVTDEMQREAAFLKHLLQIRDEVYAGKHPRIRLPPKVLEQVAPPASQQTSPARPTTNGTTNGAFASQLLPPRPESSLPQFLSHNELASPAPQVSRPFSAKSASSGIDPVLLTKSDHLIRAELQLKRQQIERILKDQCDKQRAKDDEREVLDVENLLAQAHRLVKPISGLQLPANTSENAESFDENSYYSSKADSWSSEDRDQNQNDSADVAGSLTAKGKRPANSSRAAAPPAEPPVEPAVIDLDEDPYEPAEDIEVYEPEPGTVHDDLDESDYSPPPAEVGPSESTRARGRVRTDNNYANGSGYGSSRRQSPTGPVPPIQNTRKRRRKEEREEKRRQQANKRVVRSPEPYIKDEPQSPPPISDWAETPPSKRRALVPLISDVDMAPARDGSRAQPVYHREQESSFRSLRQYDEPMSPSVVRGSQRRDDQDLRRVASLQVARRPYSPSGGELYAVPESRQMRAASHAFADRHLSQPIIREASARPPAASRYVHEPPQSPMHEYLPRAQSPIPIAPPSGRIVVDQYGNKYLATPADEPVMPPSRRVETDPYYERGVTREPTMRAPARAELYEDEDVQRMPPPPPRRYVEASNADLMEARPYRREVSHRPFEADYRPQEILERRPMPQYEEMGPPRQYLPTRAYSVRPEVVRREVPEGYARHESVQPGQVRVAAPRYREVSVVHHEPYDDRRFAFATPQERRFVGVGEGTIERAIDVAPELYAAEQRVRYRY